MVESVVAAEFRVTRLGVHPILVAVSDIIVVRREIVDDIRPIQLGLDRAALQIISVVLNFLDALAHVFVE